MTTDKEQIDKCLRMIRENIEDISTETFQHLNNKELPVEVYDVLYTINQRTHKIKHILDTYFISK